MKNLGRRTARSQSIFKGDLLRIAQNPAALLVAAGLVLLPALYAWFITLGFWDPYNRTSELKVAVVNEDTGYRLPLTGVEVDLGGRIVDGLNANEQFDWQLTTKDEAIEGVQAGRYYAAIVIPDAFSEGLLEGLFSVDRSAAKGNEGKGADDARILYYVNQKENAIAPHITDEGTTTLQERIDEEFTETAARALIDAATALTSQDGGESIEAYARLLQNSLDAAIEQLNAASAEAEALAALAQTTAQLASASSQSLDDAAKELARLEGGLSDLRETVDAAAAQVEQTMQDETGAEDEPNEQNTGEQEDAGTNTGSEGADSGGEQAETGSEGADSGGESAGSGGAQADTGAQADDTAPPLSHDELRRLIRQLKQQLDQTQEALANAAGHLQADAEQLSAADAHLAQSLTEIQRLLSRAATMFSEDAAYLQEIRNSLASALDANDLEKVRTLIGSDPSDLAAIIANPVEVDKHPVYAMPNNGSAMSPFYTTLSLWVGSVFLIAIMSTSPSPAPARTTLSAHARTSAPAPSPARQYLGRYGIFALLALAQATIVCLGNVLLLHVHVEHVGLYLLACWVTTLVFSNLVYTLAASFGNVGKALAVVLLVLQLAGSGGIFPVQMSGPFFQAIYPWLPFTHALDALQSAAAGVYLTPAGQGLSALVASDYWRALLLLALFLAPSLTLGLVLRRPVIRLNEWVSAKLKETGFMG